MLISVCIPHYNRARHLLVVLNSVATQTHRDVEVVVSDDCSTDDSEHVIAEYLRGSDLRVKYLRQPRNIGYDANLRAALGAASGDYLFILGNDDALAEHDTLSTLAGTIEKLQWPEVIFSNFHLHGRPAERSQRATATCVLGQGPATAIKYFRSLSFVAGIAFKRSAFRQHDTSRYDKSVYVQIYLAARIVASGGRLASIAESMVAKDVLAEGKRANGYADTLARDNARLMPKTGGLDQVGRCACEAILPYLPEERRRQCVLRVYSQILAYPYPYWLLDYRKQGVYQAAVNLAYGCLPPRLVRIDSVPSGIYPALFVVYAIATLGGLLLPRFVLESARRHMFEMTRRLRAEGQRS